MSEVEIQGLQQLNALLQQLPAKMEANILRGALRASGVVLRDEAKTQAPVDSGELRDSIRVSARIDKKNGSIRAKVTAGNRKVFYAHMVEHGTAAHFIKPKNRKSLFFAGLAKEVVNHPGSRRHPFMRPAFDGKSGAAIQAFADYVRARIDKLVKKGVL